MSSISAPSYGDLFDVGGVGFDLDPRILALSRPVLGRTGMDFSHRGQFGETCNKVEVFKEVFRVIAFMSVESEFAQLGKDFGILLVSVSAGQ